MTTHSRHILKTCCMETTQTHGTGLLVVCSLLMKDHEVKMMMEPLISRVLADCWLGTSGPLVGHSGVLAGRWQGVGRALAGASE